MMTKEEFLRRKAEMQMSTDALWDDIESHSKEEMRVVSVLHNADSILNQLDAVFEEKTALTNKDCSILMVATVLQLLRIYLLPRYEDKYSDDKRVAHNDESIKKMEKEEIENYKEKTKDWKSKKSEKGYRSWQEIAFTRKVPYDATRHSGEEYFNRSMHGGMHRVKTLGHDPLLGWLFGVANIVTDTISICPEYKLGEKKYRIPYIGIVV